MTDHDTQLAEQGLESIDKAALPRIVDEGGQNVWLKFFAAGRDHEIRLSPNALANLVADGFEAYRRLSRE